ncbi:MAG: WG repeat-containing protein [Oscillospiraceae bacterium]|nr:WG repeat-containing protein [Oscillospiraceae bacterium]
MSKLRAAAFAAAFVLALTSCSAPSETIPAEPEPSAIVPTATVEVTPAPTPDAYPMPEGISDLPAFDLGEIYTRRYPEIVREVRPADDYGRIIPFIGGIGLREYFDGTMFQRGHSDYIYGFATEAGEIICDAAFYSVYALEYEGKTVYLAQRAARGTGFDLVSDVANAGVETHIISGDGGFAFAALDAQDIGGGYIAVKRDGYWGVINFSGAEILPAEYIAPPAFGDGLFVLMRSIGEGCYYADESGALVLGPYTLYSSFSDPGVDYSKRSVIRQIEDTWHYYLDTIAFSDGRALFVTDAVDRGSYYHNFRYGFIDKAGELVIPDDFSNLVVPDGFSEDLAVVYSTDFDDKQEVLSERSAVIDTNGGIVLPWGEDDVYRNYDLFYRENADNSLVFYDKTGAVVRELNETGVYLGGGWFTELSGDSISLIRGDKTYLTLPAGQNGAYITRAGDDRFVYACSEPDVYFTSLIDAAGEVYLAADTSGDERTSLYRDPGDELIRVFRGDGGLGFYTTDGEVVLPVEYEVAQPFPSSNGPLFTVRRGNYGGVVRPGGEWVVKVSLLDSLPD